MDDDKWLARIDAIGKLGTGVICAGGLVYAVVFGLNQALDILQSMVDTLDVIEVTLQQIKNTYTGN